MELTTSHQYTTVSKAIALLEVAVVFIVTITGCLLLWAYDPWVRFEASCFRWHVVSKLLFLVALPMLYWKLRHKDVAPVGLGLSCISWQLKIAGLSLAVLGPASMAFWLISLLGASYKSWLGAGILSAVFGVVLVVLLRLVKSNPRPEHVLRSTPLDTLWPLLTIPVAITFAYVFNKLQLKPAVFIVFALVSTGLAEEFFFRGILLGHLNKALGKPFTFGGMEWGWGLLLSSFLFGLIHYFNSDGTLPWVVWTSIAGLCYGVLREWSGGIIVPSLAHGIPLLFRLLG